MDMVSSGFAVWGLQGLGFCSCSVSWLWPSGVPSSPQSPIYKIGVVIAPLLGVLGLLLPLTLAPLTHGSESYLPLAPQRAQPWQVMNLTKQADEKQTQRGLGLPPRSQ